MKKKAYILSAAAALGTLAIWAAAGGGASDPLVSLSHINGAYTASVLEETEARLDRADRAASDAADARLSGATEHSSISAAVWTERRIKEGDALSGGTGLNVLPLAGSISASYAAGAVIDVTAGVAIPSGTVLSANHRYLVAEDTVAEFTAVSKTAVVDCQGPCALTESDTVDYNAMAAALKELHLFRGSFTGYGQGFDLELSPTRLQALIMFIRVLGEEEEALTYSGSTPFADIHAGTDAAKYVSYAYAKGYTNGYTTDSWRPAAAVNVYQYTEFMLRALGYSSTANTDLSDTMERAADCGFLTARESAALKSAPFLRAQLVYISYAALDVPTAAGSDTLGDMLKNAGVFTDSEFSSARQLVSDSRL